MEKRAARRSQFNGIAVLIFVGYVILLARITAVIPEPLLFLLANISILFVATVLSVPLHELGHAVAYWLLGGRVFSLRWGAGPTLLRRRLGSVTVLLGPNPFVGMAHGGFPTLRLIRLRFGLMVMGGVTANLMAALFLYMRLDGWEWSALRTSLAWSEVIILANVLLVIFSLFPRRAAIGAAAYPTDGAWLLTLATGKIAPAVVHQYFYYTGITQAIEGNDLVGAMALASEARSLYPDILPVQELEVMVRLMGGDGAMTLPFYEAVLHGDDFARLTGPQQAMIFNNTAWAGLLTGDPAQLEPAAARAGTAFAMMPWHPSIRGTYGALLVEQGDLIDGVTHLDWAFAHHQDNRSKAIALAYNALAQQRQGLSRAATKKLADARALSPHEVVVERVARQIEEPAEA